MDAYLNTNFKKAIWRKIRASENLAESLLRYCQVLDYPSERIKKVLNETGVNSAMGELTKLVRNKLQGSLEKAADDVLQGVEVDLVLYNLLKSVPFADESLIEAIVNYYFWYPEYYQKSEETTLTTGVPAPVVPLGQDTPIVQSCPHCGAELSDDDIAAKKCSKCGNSIE